MEKFLLPAILFLALVSVPVFVPPVPHGGVWAKTWILLSAYAVLCLFVRGLI